MKFGNILFLKSKSFLGLASLLMLASLSSCHPNERKNIFRVGTFTGYQEKDGLVVDEKVSYLFVVKRIKKEDFSLAEGQNVIHDVVTSQRPNFLSLSFARIEDGNEKTTFLNFSNLKDISKTKKEKAIYQDDKNNVITPIFEESLSKAYLKEGFYRIVYQDLSIVLRDRTEK